MLRRRFGRAGSGARREVAPSLVGARPVGTAGRMKRAKPPNAVGRGPLLDAPGFSVAIVCIVRDEAEYLEEWIGYHVALGVDHFFIYDNGSSDGSSELLARYQNHGLVTRIDWPLGGGQLAAYNHALRFFGRTSDWLAYYDVDEFLVPLVDADIPSFLARFPRAADVRVPRVEFGFSGHRTRPSGLTVDAYTQVADVLGRDPTLPARVKSIVQPAAISAVDVHLAFPADVLPEGAPRETAESEVAGLAQLNHYYTRSFEEFEAKRFRGSATGRIARPAVPFDIPTLATDTSAQRFSARTVAMIERLRRLEDQPYMYGSQLRLPAFPRPNDLGRFAEFALANTAAGLVEPARVAAARLKNLHAGVGLVADIAATGYRPRRGALAGSVHTAVLVEHMRGRIEVDLANEQDRRRSSASSGRSDLGPDGAVRLMPVGGAAELAVDLPAASTLRCWSLGLLFATPVPVSMTLQLERADGSLAQPVRLELPASTCLAGVVEVEPEPVDARQVRLRIEGTDEPLDLFDLFLVSTG